MLKTRMPPESYIPLNAALSPDSGVLSSKLHSPKFACVWFVDKLRPFLAGCCANFCPAYHCNHAHPPFGRHNEQTVHKPAKSNQ